MIARQNFSFTLLAGAVLLALTACAPSGDDRAELRYRLTVEVETPQGTRSGSSVIEVVAVRNPDWVNPEGRGVRAKHRGEAVVVDLPEGQTLFALLKSDGGSADPADWPVMAFEKQIGEASDLVASLRQMTVWADNGVILPIPATDYIVANGGSEVSALPLLVTFGDIRDTKTVERVNPDNLEASFGAGYRLKAITVQVTNAPVTMEIEKRLELAGWSKGQGLDRTRGVTASPTLAQQLGYTDLNYGDSAECHRQC